MSSWARRGSPARTPCEVGGADAPLLEGGHRHRSARRRAPRRRPGGKPASDQRDRLLPDRTAPAAGGDRRRPHRLRAGPGLCPLRLRGDAGRALPRRSWPGRTRTPQRSCRRLPARRNRRAGEHRGEGGHRRRDGEKRVISGRADGRATGSSDAILVGAGRAPNVEGLGLEAAGVAYDRQGRRVNDTLQTSNPRIYAAGDICPPTSSPTPPTPRPAS